MSDLSARLNLPFIAPAQAQKHVTHNEALVVLDALVQAGVVAFDLSTPPVGAAPGAVFVVADNPSGDWAGQAGKLALLQNGGWMFLAPSDGWRAWDIATSRLMVFSGGIWMPLVGHVDRVDGLGIHADWDATNRLSIASPASLFNHDGAGHQIKVNKAAPTDTASLLFQTGYTGHAEMGLSGDDSFAVKVSADGVTWTESVRISPATGQMTGAAIQQSATDVTIGRLMRTDWGYSRGNIVGPVTGTGSVVTGAIIERGSNADGTFVKFADGTLICQRELPINVATTTAQIFNFAHAFSPNGRGDICTSFSHMSGTPNAALFLKNIRAMGHTNSGWLISLDVAGTSSNPAATAERMSAMAVGRWA